MDTIMFIGAPGKLLFSESFKNSFAKFNYKIVEPEYLKFSEQNFILKKIKSQRKKYLDDFFEKQNSLYINALKNNNIKFVFIVNNSRVTPPFLQYCKQNNIPVFSYLYDSIRWKDKGLEYIDYYTDIFSYEPSDSSVLIENDNHVKYIPLGCDESVYKYNPLREYVYDICFVGTLDKRRLRLLNEVAEFAYKNNKKMIVYTSVQINKIPHLYLLPKILIRRLKYNFKYKYLMKYLINEPIFGEDLAKLYNESKICLNIHVGTELELHTGLNPRGFEILGCRSFELIDEGHLKHTSIKNGKDIIEFAETNDLMEKIRYYLDNDKKRENIAENGNKKVLEKYTIDKTVEKILKYIKRVLDSDEYGFEKNI